MIVQRLYNIENGWGNNFARAFWMIVPSVKNFQSTCRSFLTVDETHLKWQGSWNCPCGFNIGWNKLLPITYVDIKIDNYENWL